VETWGGISYSLEALSAALPPHWTVAPLIRLGRDREDEARAYLSTLPGLESDRGLLPVDLPTTSVELRYDNGIRRSERLSGRMPPWSWEALEPLLADADAVYVNFITGFEMELWTARLFRQHLSVPSYADLHSLFLAISPDGVRNPRPLESWESWVRSFDVVQMNEGEFGLLADPEGDPWRRAERVLGKDTKLIAVTLGHRGSAYMATPDTPWTLEGARVARPGGERELVALRGEVRPADPVPGGDTTGCGDVWGATFFARLLAGDGLETAMGRANRAAARNVTHTGAPGLRLRLAGAG